MAGEEYIKRAASDLRRAAVARREDINNLRKKLDEVEKNVRETVSNLNKAINDNNGQMAKPDASSEERADRLRLNGKLDSEIVDKQHELSATREEIKQQIKSIEQEIQSMYTQAAQFDQRSGINNFLV